MRLCVRSAYPLSKTRSVKSRRIEAAFLSFNVVEE